jgi:hypothetical protein
MAEETFLLNENSLREADGTGEEGSFLVLGAAISVETVNNESHKRS